jgi:tetratricopeptide (TPR) repeat protein
MYLSMLGVTLACAYGLSRLRTKGLWVAASIIFVLGILSFWQTRYWNDGMALYQHALAANPESDMAYHNLGRTLGDKKKYKEAIQYYKKALELDPDYVGAYHNLGKSQFELGQQSEGIVNMLQAVNLKPDYADGHYDLANAYQEIDSSQKAIFHYRRVLAVEPENHRAYNNMGNALVALQDTSSAIGCYKKAIELSPRYSGYVANLARLNEDARKQVSTQVASAESLNDAGKLNDLGVYYATNQNLPKAIECFEKALRVDSTNVDALSNLANASMISGDFEKAIELYDMSIALDSTKDNAYYNKGVALHRQKRVSATVEWYRKALEVNQGNKQAREVLRNLGALPQ